MEGNRLLAPESEGPGPVRSFYPVGLQHGLGVVNSLILMKHKRWLFPFLIFFCLVSVSVDFFHTETGFEVDYDCPACLFHSMVYASAGPLVMTIAFILALIVVLRDREAAVFSTNRPVVRKNKSPPVV